MTLHVSGSSYTAFVVIDSIFAGSCSGGVRIVDDVSEDEITQLAREMTLKYSLFRLPRGGAKAGIALEAGISPQQRADALGDFGRRLGVLIRSGIYNPGMDMNCGPNDLAAIYAGAGIGLGQSTDTAYFTAISVGHAIEGVAASLGKKPCSLAIAGFGRVAAHLASRLSRDEFRIVSLSTVEGGVGTAAGYESTALVHARDQWGDTLVEHIPGARISHDEVLTEAVDILVPASRTGVITSALAAQLQARAVVPIANCPFGAGALEVLRARGIVCLPGYLTNCGGVLGSSLYDLGVAKSGVDAFFDRHYRRAIDVLLETSKRTGRAVHDLAESIAVSRVRERNSTPPTPGLLQKVESRLGRRYPRSLRRRRAHLRYGKALTAISTELASLELPR